MASGRSARVLIGLCLLSALGAAAPLLGSEVIVFKDGRSLVVSSHKAMGSWIYLSIEGGEIAVLTARIAEIRNEGEEVGRYVPPPTGPVALPPQVEPPPPENAVADAGTDPDPLAKAEAEAERPPEKSDQGPILEPPKEGKVQATVKNPASRPGASLRRLR